MAKKGGLGKGLDALFLDNDTQVGGGLMSLRVSSIEPNKDQPRAMFDQEALSELADSIREHGVLQPIVVRTLPEGGYQIIAGERRWRASRMAGLSEIPAMVIDAEDGKVMELALIENLQRENLTVIEEALGYRTLMENYGLTQEQVAKRLGKSRPVVANTLRILKLSPGALKLLEKGDLTPGHARVLAGLEREEMMDQLAAEVVKGSLTVRQLEKLAAQRKTEKAAPPTQKVQMEKIWGNIAYREIELSLGESLGRKVQVKKSPSGGMLEIEFYSEEDLVQLAKKLAGGE